MCETYGFNPTLLPTSLMQDFTPPTPTLPRVEGDVRGHQRVWVEACKGGAPCSSNFDYAGPLTEMVLMGNLALRSFMLSKVVTINSIRRETRYPGRKKLRWDGENMRITNFDDANQFVRRTYRDGWSLGE